MKILTILLVLLPLAMLGQTKQENKKRIPKRITVKPVTDSINFIDDTVRNSIIEYLNENKIDLNICYIDRFVREDDENIIVILKDGVSMKNLKEFKETGVMKQNYNHIGGTFTYNKRTRRLAFVGDK